MMVRKIILLYFVNIYTCDDLVNRHQVNIWFIKIRFNMILLFGLDSDFYVH